MPPGLRDWVDVLQRTSEFTRKLETSSPGGEAYAFNEMIDHMSISRDFHAPVGPVAGHDWL